VKKNLILLGMMGVGKTTIGKIIAKKQKFKFIDTDLRIEEKNSMTIAEIFKKKGEKFFRSEEEKLVLSSLEKEEHVIALGGGSFINKLIREKVLKNAISFWLDLNIKTLNSRVGWNSKRPLLEKDSYKITMLNLYAKRKIIYKLAHYKIICDKMSKSVIVKKIIKLYESN